MNNTFYYNVNEEHNTINFSKRLAKLMEDNYAYDCEIVILCIGSDRSTGDSLGPLIGHKLKNHKFKDVFVYGDLKKPIHAINLEECLYNIYSKHENSFIIAIDASLGRENHIGYVTLSDIPLRPGLGVKKALPSVGDLCITGIVNFSSSFDSMLLQSTRLSIVMDLADYIYNGICTALLIRNKKGLLQNKSPL